MDRFDELCKNLEINTRERKTPVKRKLKNTNKKGNNNEHKVAQFYRNLGYICITSPRQSWINGHAIARANDFFGIWDIIAVDKNDGKTVYIQVKTNKKPPKAYIEQLKAFPAIHKVLAICHDNVKEIEIIEL